MHEHYGNVRFALARPRYSLVRYACKSSVATVAGHIGRLTVVAVRASLLEPCVHIVVVQYDKLQTTCLRCGKARTDGCKNYRHERNVCCSPCHGARIRMSSVLQGIQRFQKKLACNH